MKEYNDRWIRPLRIELRWLSEAAERDGQQKLLRAIDSPELLSVHIKRG